MFVIKYNEVKQNSYSRQDIRNSYLKGRPEKIKDLVYTSPLVIKRLVELFRNGDNGYKH